MIHSNETIKEQSRAEGDAYLQYLMDKKGKDIRLGIRQGENEHSDQDGDPLEYIDI